jgi:hypothetical protein
LFQYALDFASVVSLPWVVMAVVVMAVVVMAKAKPLCYGNGQMHMVMYKNNHGK